MRQAVIAAVLLPLALGGCVATVPSPEVALTAETADQAAARTAALTFIEVITTVEPVAEAVCRSRGIARNCDFLIVVDDRPGQPPNAFQTLDRRGRPVIGFTLALIADARNADELAFVLGHEAAHHIAGHIPRRREEALSAALLAGLVARGSGLSPEEVKAAQELGAEVATLTYTREYELEADALGAEIALIAGFDPIRGTGFFDRLPDPGNRFLTSHPPNSQRKALVIATTRQLGG
ncbi:MAG: peptidase M48 [Rhodobacterales bacterium 12-65-15]|nr:MAG: peptidase M48 [Rhodobacterales bacterium 12-65-15]